MQRICAMVDWCCVGAWRGVRVKRPHAVTIHSSQFHKTYDCVVHPAVLVGHSDGTIILTCMCSLLYMLVTLCF
jgi:hypothetical protein